MDDNGTAYVATTSTTGDGQSQTVVHAVRSDETIATTEPIPGTRAGAVVIGNDGTVYLVTETGAGTTADPSVVHTTIMKVAQSPSTVV